MRLSPLSLVALLVVTAIVVYLTVASLGAGVSGTSATGAGSYENAIKAAQQSVAAQDRAAQRQGFSSVNP
jgi:hypothetical protein